MDCTTTAIDYDEIPTELRVRLQWVLWRDEQGNKTPYSAMGGMASSTDQSTWTTFDVVTSAYERGSYSGVGFVFSASDPFIGIDLDGCRDPETGTVDPWAKEIIEACDTYTEVSPSGTGVKLIGVGKSPFETGKNQKLPQHGERGGKAAGIEIYDHGRYFTVTGWRLADSDREPCVIQPKALELVKKLIDETKAATRPASSATATQSAKRPTNDDRARLVDRCRKYIDKMPAAISGQGGHGATFSAACVCFKFGLTDGEALEVMSDFNTRCEPPWSDWELQHKLTDARDTVTREGTFGSMTRDDWSGGPAADLTGIMAQVASGAQATTSDDRVDDDEPPTEPIADCPESLLTIPGFVAELVDYTLAVAPYPNRVLAFAGALSLLAMLTGRKVRDESNMRTNVMLLALAGSASGKDYPRKVNAEILKQIGMRECLGDAFASGQGLEDALFANPAMLFQTDEFDTLMQSVAKSRDGTQEATVSALLKFYTSANSTFPMRRKAGQPASYIENPHLCVFGTAIPEMFYASLTERMLTNGLLARMIVLEAGPRGRGQDAKSTEIPEGILQAARDWAGFNPGLGNLSSLNPTPLKIASTDDARRLRREAREAAEDEYSAAEKRHDVAAMAVWGRAPEQIAKLAMLFACSETNPLMSNPVIGKEACEWAREFAFHQVRRMLAMVRGHVAETEFDRECLKTLRRLTKLSPDGMEHWKLLKRSKLKAKDFRDVVQTLHERQQIQTKIEGNRGPVYFSK